MNRLDPVVLAEEFENFRNTLDDLHMKVNGLAVHSAAEANLKNLR